MDKEELIITKNHSIDYEEHSYQKYKQVILDLEQINKKDLILKLHNYNYLKTFLNAYAIKNNARCTSSIMLLNIFKEEYGDIEINYDNIDKQKQQEILNKYNNKKNKSNNIQDIINLKNLTKTAYNYLRNYREFHHEMDNNLLNMKFNNLNIVTKIDVTFIRKNKNITKDIYIIMTEFMINNIANKNNIQYFIDVTYYATPPNNKKFKILIIIAFNRETYNTILCNISLISNENKETFCQVFNYLKNKHLFNPNAVTIDYSLAEYNAIRTVFPNCRIIPCFFHFIQNISKRINNLRSKNFAKKKNSKKFTC